MKLGSNLGHEISDPKLAVKPGWECLDMKVFISYRRRDSQYITDHIYDSLVPEFGREDVFVAATQTAAAADAPSAARAASTVDLVVVRHAVVVGEAGAGIGGHAA